MPSKSIQSWEAVQQAVDARRPDGGKVPEGIKLTLIALCVYVGPTNGVGVYPSQATLAERLGIAERTVRRHLAMLEQWSMIEREYRQRQDGRGRTSDLVRLSFLRSSTDQPDSSVRLVHDQPDNRDDQPDTWDYQPDNGDRTNRTTVSGEPPVEPPVGTTREEPPGFSAALSSEINLPVPSRNGNGNAAGSPSPRGNDRQVRGEGAEGASVNGDRPNDRVSTNGTSPHPAAVSFDDPLAAKRREDAEWFASAEGQAAERRLRRKGLSPEAPPRSRR